ncbi:MAG: glycosyltransferase family 39 protein [bacterium]|nr:glycosyltransferase family 39 protein [bacterium]
MSKPKLSLLTRTILSGLVLAALCAIAFLLRLPMVAYNLPIAANMDERSWLGVLYHLDTISLNPEFFHHPTLLFYLIHFVRKTLTSFDHTLFVGRLINLLLSIGMALAAFRLSVYLLKSRPAALLTAALTLFSPILIMNSGYVTTDILAGLLTLIGLIYFIRFFDEGGSEWWWIAVIAAGLAISTKYSAVLLILTYLLMEFLRKSDSNLLPSGETGILQKRMEPRIVPWMALAAGSLLAIAYLLFPLKDLLNLISSVQSINSSIDAEDLRFLQSLRNKLFFAGVFILALSAATFRWRSFRSRFAGIRPYLACLIALVVFLLGSPGVILSWKIFLLQFGFEMKANALPGTQQWLVYFYDYYAWESLIAFGFCLVGVWLAMSRKKSVGMLLLYALIVYLVIGSATRSFDRYLTPLLPIIFIFAGYGITEVVTYLRQKNRVLSLLTLLLILGGISLEIAPTIRSYLSTAELHDEAYRSYQKTLVLKPVQVYFSGWVPDVELKMIDLVVEEIPKADLADSSSAFFRTFNDRAILITDSASHSIVAESGQRGLNLIWQTDEGFGQYIYAK